MSSETSWCVTNSAWVSEKLDETVVISTRDEGLILIEVNSVDMGSISAFWEDTINEPSELGVTRSPNGSCGIGFSTLVLITTWHIEVEEFVSIADGFDVRIVHAPVDTCDGSVMALAGGDE